MKQQNSHFSYTIAINTTKKNVWDTLIDVKHWPQWDTELLDAKIDGTFADGATGTMQPKKGPTLQFNISELIDMQSYTINVIMPVGKMIIKRSLTESDEGILFTDDIAFTGFFKNIFGIVLGRQFRKILPSVLNNFKQIAECK